MSNDDSDGSDPTQAAPTAELPRGFPLRGYAAALERLLEASRLGPGVLVLTGDAGTGKTTLVADLAAQLAWEGHHVERVASPRMDTEDLLRLVGFARDLGGQCATREWHPSDPEVPDPGQRPAGEPAILIVDDAQDLASGLLEDLCNLFDSLGRQGVSLLILLSGREGLWTFLERPEHRAIRQRILVSCRLGPLDRDEMEGYAEHALGVAGWTGYPAFDAEALELIHERTGGVPRLISLTIGHLLWNGRCTGAQAIGAVDAEAVLSHLSEDYPELLAASPASVASVGPVDAYPPAPPSTAGMPAVVVEGLGGGAEHGARLPALVPGRDLEASDQGLRRAAGWTLGWMLAGLAAVVAAFLLSNLEPLSGGPGPGVPTPVSEQAKGTGYTVVAEAEKKGPAPAPDPIALAPLLASAPLVPEPPNPSPVVSEERIELDRVAQAERDLSPEVAAVTTTQREGPALEGTPAEGDRVAGADESQTAPAAQSVDNAQGARQSEVARCLDLADRALSADRLTVPANDNAYEHYRVALALDPGNPRARAGLRNIVTRYRVLAEGRLEKGDLRGARRFASRGLALSPADSELLAIKRKAVKAEAGRPERDSPELLARLEDWLRSGRSDRSLFLDL